MRFDVVTLFPEMIRTLFEHGVVGRAADSGRVRLETWNPRDYATDRHGTVDDRPYGGGPGMVMKVEPARTAIRAAREAADPAPVVYLTPQGRPLTSGVAAELAGRKRLILLCGRYEGVDERLIELEVDEELSVGDYVLSGGELPAMVVMDAVSRLVPGVLGHKESAARDSFAGGLLDCPHYTRPEVVDGRRVPEILTSGDHGAVEQWRRRQALEKTWVKRPDLLEHQDLNEKEQAMIAAWSRDQND